MAARSRAAWTRPRLHDHDILAAHALRRRRGHIVAPDRTPRFAGGAIPQPDDDPGAMIDAVARHPPSSDRRGRVGCRGAMTARAAGCEPAAAGAGGPTVPATASAAREMGKSVHAGAMLPRVVADGAANEYLSARWTTRASDRPA